jgi:glycosyltransferase involved in cell wall biosynthesis
MRVAWIMAVHNNQNTIAAALRSIQTQTSTDWTLVVVDDGSTDDSSQIIDQVAADDPRIGVLHNSRNVGLAESLNRAWRHHPADVYVRTDADDASCTQRLELQLDYMRQHPNVSVLGSAATLIDEKGEEIGCLSRPAQHERLAARILRENPFIHPTVAIRRSYLEICQGYDPRLKRSQDYDLWLRGYRHARFHNLSLPLVNYRLRPIPSWSAIYWGTRTLVKAISRERLQASAYWYPLRYLAATTLMQLRLRVHPALRNSG